MTYSLHTKAQALRYFDEGNTVKRSAFMAHVSYSTLLVWLKARERGDGQPSKRKRIINLEELKEFLKKHPAKSLHQLHKEWDGPPCHWRTFYNALREINHQFKSPKYHRHPLKDD
jgi:transposase